MKRVVPVLLSFLLYYVTAAQKVQVIAPSKPVVAGTAFQLQIVITDTEHFIELLQPQFDSLSVISGPNYYKGETIINGKTHPIKNITYTLVSDKTGRIRIKGISARFIDSEERTGDIFITVISQPPASFHARSSYTDVSLFAPSSEMDRERLARENLFVKAIVNRSTCFIGEPVIATFKLYSRLQSTSEVLDAPSLYGFSVIDILNINEAHQAVETINGKIFNTSILRKLQLYPDQEGKLVIDEMRLVNEVEFEDPSGNIANNKLTMFTETKPLNISVRPLPGTPPASFSGAVGEFSIKAQIEKSTLQSSQQGRLSVTISGKGNFIQFGKPVFSWPAFFDVFEPEVTEEFNKNAAPLEGSRTYSIGFTTDSTGNFIIPPLKFSFFSPEEAVFKTIQTDSLPVYVLPALKKTTKIFIAHRNFNQLWLALIIISVILLASVLYHKKRKKKPSVALPEKPFYVSHSVVLRSLDTSVLNARHTCTEISRILKKAEKEYSKSIEQEEEIANILSECNLLIYSELEDETKKLELKQRAIKVLYSMENSSF